ncbi:MAG: dNTP triphosphohydrolase [Bacteroidetes bacterium]|nr:dNTP triphosphohydrolase [Bacteroidota bacterium]
MPRPKSLYLNRDKLRILSEKDRNTDPRSVFRRDYARLIHSNYFRKLSNKTQLFPGHESDFFRNRLTHSLEVAQIAKSIALKINTEHNYFQKNNIDLDLIEFSGLAHDLGHAPFGHIGEKALDKCLHKNGGFEGNGQTLRILTKIEKKRKLPATNDCGFISGKDFRLGLNLSFRTLASILKYNNKIPVTRKYDNSVVKGYYQTEAEIVKQIIKKVTGYEDFTDPFKTIECQIMDIADDIAYSTFDLEDTFKANFISPLHFLAVGPELLDKIFEKITSREEVTLHSKDEILKVLQVTIQPFINIQNFEEVKNLDLNIPEALLPSVGLLYSLSTKLSDDGYIRNAFTSGLIHEYINGISVEFNKETPALSKIVVDPEIKLKIEIIKYFIFYTITSSSRLRIPEYRGNEIVTSIFDVLSNGGKCDSKDLLPKDFQELYTQSSSKNHRIRVICDFIAGMTDRYIIEFYGRIKSENPQTIFKPV